MARLLIISRSLALGMRLTDLHDVEEHAADELDAGLPKVEGYDVLVLDVGDPVLAVNTVNSLREDEQAIPVMLISGYQPEWEQVEAQQVEGVHVVPLPITRQALLRGVAILRDEDPDLITVDPTGAFPVIEVGSGDASGDATVIAQTQPVPTKKPAGSGGSAGSKPDGAAAGGAGGSGAAGAAKSTQAPAKGGAAAKPGSSQPASSSQGSSARPGSAPSGSPQGSPAKAGPAQAGSPQGGSVQGSSARSGSPEAGAAQGGSAQGGSAQAGSARGGSAQGGSARGGSAQSGSPQAGSAQAGPARGGSAQDGSARGGSAQGGSAQAGSAQAGPARGGSAQGGLAQGGSAKPAQAASGKAAPGKAAPGKAAPAKAGEAQPGQADEAKAGPADVAAAKAVQQAAAQAKKAPQAGSAENKADPGNDGQAAPGPKKQAGTSGTLGQQFAARRALGQGMGQQSPQQPGQPHVPQHDRNRRPGPRPAPDQIEVTPSQVAGLSYSSPVARPFSEQPPPGRFPLDRAPRRDQAQGEPAPQNQPPQNQQPPSSPLGGRQSRWRSDPPPETGSIPMNSSNIAANRRMARLGDRPRKFQRRTNPEDSTPRTPGRGLVTDPLGPRTDPYGLPTISALERRLDAEAAALVNPRTTADGETAIRTADLIRTLQERAGELYGVSDTSQVLADDVIVRASAEAAAVLVPDGAVWRVSGGVGLRPLERRLELTESHWLVTEIGSGGRAVLIDDTDIVRQQLAGAPLAAWRHLMAVPVPDVRVIMVLARSEKGGAFTGSDLTAVHSPVRESAVLLAQAIETRQLARALAPLREPEPESGR